MEGLEEVFERTLQLALSLFSIVLLAGASYFASIDRLGTAGLLVSIFVVAVLTLSLPRLRVIEGFGVKAQLDEAVRKAELTLEQFKRLARVTTRQGFLQMYRGEGRDAPYSEKHATIAALNDGLEAAGLDEREAAELRRPLFEALALDLVSPVQTVAIFFKVRRIREIEAELKGHEVRMPGSIDPDDVKWSVLRAEKQRLMEIKIPNLEQSTTPENFGAVLDYCAGPFPRTDDENRKLLAIIASAKSIMAGCLEARNVTADSDEFLRFKLRIFPGAFFHDTSEERAEGLLRSRFAGA